LCPIHVFDATRRSLQMLATQVGIAQHHLVTGPATQLLQLGQTGAALNVLRGPGMPQVVPAKILDPCPLQSLSTPHQWFQLFIV
jgi:hypothetical protein